MLQVFGVFWIVVVSCDRPPIGLQRFGRVVRRAGELRSAVSCSAIDPCRVMSSPLVVVTVRKAGWMVLTTRSPAKSSAYGKEHSGTLVMGTGLPWHMHPQGVLHVRYIAYAFFGCSADLPHWLHRPMDCPSLADQSDEGPAVAAGIYEAAVAEPRGRAS